MKKLDLKMHNNIFILKDNATQKFIKFEQADQFRVDEAKADTYFGFLEEHQYLENDLTLDEMLEIFFRVGLLLNKVEKIRELTTTNEHYLNDNTFIKDTYYLSNVTILSVGNIKDEETKKRIAQPNIKLFTYQELLDESTHDKAITALLAHNRFLLEAI